MPRFGKDKDSARKEELDRQAAEEVERLTRRGGPPGMGGGTGGGMPGMPGMGQLGMPSPLERIAEEVRDAPRPSMRKQAPARKAAARPQQAFTPLPSGAVGSSFGPGGLNPGPRMGGTAPPPPAFGGGEYDEDYGGHVTGPPVFNAEPDEDEEMSITEMALMDHAARRGYDPEDLVIHYDAGTAEEMRDAAMRQFYERQHSRRPGTGTNNPFAPAGMRGGGPAGPAGRSRSDDPAAVGGALAQRLANKRRREAEEARRAQVAAEPAPAAAQPAPTSPSARTETPQAKAEPADDGGALARALARRRQALGMDRPSPSAQSESPSAQPEAPPAQMEPEPQPEEEPEPSAPRLRAVPLEPVAEEGTPGGEETAASTPTRRPAKRAAKKAATKKAPAAKKAAKAAATPTKAKKAPAAAKAKKAGASLAKAPATKKAAAARKVGKAKTVFCIECGEKNPAIAKFCFNCGTRLAAPEN